MEEEPRSSKPQTIAVTIAPSLLHRLTNLDATCSLLIHTACQPLPRSILKTLEISGDGRFWFPVPVALFFSPLASKSDHLRWILIGLFFGSLFDLVLVGVVKYLVRRPRPIYNKGMHLTLAVDHWSFPSGHSSRVWFIATFLHLSSALLRDSLVQLRSSDDEIFVNRWIDSDGKTVQLFVSIVCLWSASTSISRVLLGRHFVFDVIAGTCLGVLEAQFAFWFMKCLDL